MLKQLALATLMLVALPIYADTTQVQSWTVTAQCDANIMPNVGCFAPAVMNATFTTTMETGTFPCPMCDTGFELTGTFPVVTNIVGTFDGQPMMLTSTTGWIYENNPLEGIPQDIGFSVNGTNYALFWDVFYQLDSSGPNEYLDFSATDPLSIPEPAEWIMLLGGLDALLIAAWLKRKS